MIAVAGRLRISKAVTPNDRRRWNQLRHELFCLGGSGEALETCQAQNSDAEHDIWDRPPTDLYIGSIEDRPAACARLIFGSGPHGLQSVDIAQKHGLTLPRDARYTSEASRVGLLSAHQGTPDGTALINGLFGDFIFTSITGGISHAYFTSRPGMLRRLIRLIPIEFPDPPVNYGQEESGPHTRKPTPTWLVIGSYHEFAAAVMWFQPPLIQQQMFPLGFDWLDLSNVRSPRELAGLMARNEAKFTQDLRDWRNRYPIM